MNTEKYLNSQKKVLYVNLIIGLSLLIFGIILHISENTIFPKYYIFFDVSLLAFLFAGLAHHRIKKTTKKPRSMHKTIINEYDERLVAIRNEAEAKTINILRIGIYIAYLMTESNHNILILAFLILSFIIPGIIEASIISKEAM